MTGFCVHLLRSYLRELLSPQSLLPPELCLLQLLLSLPLFLPLQVLQSLPLQLGSLVGVTLQSQLKIYMTLINITQSQGHMCPGSGGLTFSVSTSLSTVVSGMW